MRRATPKDRQLISRTLVVQGIKSKQSATPAFAYISEGRWVADCDNCNGAEFVTEGEPMVCGTCGEVSKVTWPKEVDKIEAVLAKRKLVNQNFLPGETVAMLKAENKAHGI